MKQTQPAYKKKMSNPENEEKTSDNHHELENSLEEEKCEETEIKMKEDKEVRNKTEKAFFKKLQERLAVKNDKVHNDTKDSENLGVELIRRISINNPNCFFNRPTDALGPSKSPSKMGNPSFPPSARDHMLIKKAEDIIKKQQIRMEKEDIQKVKNEAEMNQKKQKEIQKALENFLDSTAIVIIMALATIFVLIGDDIKSLFLPLNYDYGFDCTKTFCLAVFTIEIMLSCAAKKEYILSFFFWLDLVSTFSLIQDIGFIIDPMVYGNTE